MPRMMKHILATAVLVGALLVAVRAGQTPQGQPARPQTPPAPSADPYAGNAAPGTTQFPLAAPAGKDSGARTTAPAGAANQGPFDPGTWKYGSRTRTSVMRSTGSLLRSATFRMASGEGPS